MQGQQKDSFGIGMTASTKQSMVNLSIKRIDKGQHLTDFTPFLENLFTADELKGLLKDRVLQLSKQDDNNNSNATSLVRSFFLRTASIYDILPNDVIVNILKYLKPTVDEPSSRHHKRHPNYEMNQQWIQFPVLSKAFKKIIYENASPLFNDYTIITHDEGMPITLNDEILRLHVYHFKHLCKIQYRPTFNSFDGNMILKKMSNNWGVDTRNDMNDGFTSTDCQSDYNAETTKRLSYITMDKCQFPWHLIKKWEIVCSKTKSTWQMNTEQIETGLGNTSSDDYSCDEILDTNEKAKREAKKKEKREQKAKNKQREMDNAVESLKRSNKCLQVVSIPLALKSQSNGDNDNDNNNDEEEDDGDGMSKGETADSKREIKDQEFAHFAKFKKIGSDKLIEVLNTARQYIRCLTLNNFPCEYYDIKNRLQNKYPSFDRLFYVCLKNISCSYDINFGINEIIFKEKLNIFNLEILELCNISNGIKYNTNKSFSKIIKEMGRELEQQQNEQEKINGEQKMERNERMKQEGERDGRRLSSSGTDSSDSSDINSSDTEYILRQDDIIDLTETDIDSQDDVIGNFQRRQKTIEKRQMSKKNTKRKKGIKKPRRRYVPSSKIPANKYHSSLPVLKDWLQLKSRHLLIANILNTLNEQVKIKEQKLNLKVLKIDFGTRLDTWDGYSNNYQRDKFLFFYLYYPKLYDKMKQLNLVSSGLEQEFQKYFRWTNSWEVIKTYFNNGKFGNYIDAGNVEITIPSCNNLQVLSLIKLMCKVDMKNVIEQGSDLILLTMEDMIPYQLITTGGTPAKVAKQSNFNNVIINKTNDVGNNRLYCDCLLVKHNDNEFENGNDRLGMIPCWRYFVQQQHLKYNNKEKRIYGISNVSDSGDIVRIDRIMDNDKNVVLLARFCYGDVDYDNGYGVEFMGVNIIKLPSNKSSKKKKKKATKKRKWKGKKSRKKDKIDKNKQKNTSGKGKMSVYNKFCQAVRGQVIQELGDSRSDIVSLELDRRYSQLSQQEKSKYEEKQMDNGDTDDIDDNDQDATINDNNNNHNETDFPWFNDDTSSRSSSESRDLKSNGGTKRIMCFKRDINSSEDSSSDTDDSITHDKRKKIEKKRTDIIDLYVNKGLRDKNVYFVQLRSLNNLYYRLIKFRYLTNGIYNKIWPNYQKWFDMRLIQWVKDPNQIYMSNVGQVRTTRRRKRYKLKNRRIFPHRPLRSQY